MKMDHLSHLTENRDLSPASLFAHLGSQIRGSKLFEIQCHHPLLRYPCHLAALLRFHSHRLNPPEGQLLSCSSKNLDCVNFILG